MNEHQKLKEICDKISYNPYFLYQESIWFFRETRDILYLKLDIREIIFTQEFINKYVKYYLPEWYWKKHIKDFYVNLIINTDIIVNYLYNLII